MNLKKLSRQDKEKLYVIKMTALQRRWGNPIDSNWDFKDWTDDELDKGLKDTISQIRFEKGWNIIKIILYLVVIGLVIFIFKR